MNPKTSFGISFIFFALVIGISLWIWQKGQPGRLDDFVKCVSDQEVKFYGTFWCPHCQNQKVLFGTSAKGLPYIECSTPDSNGQLGVCTKANIQLYPTWKFKDGSVHEGEITLNELSQKTGCQLP